MGGPVGSGNVVWKLVDHDFDEDAPVREEVITPELKLVLNTELTEVEFKYGAPAEE